MMSGSYSAASAAAASTAAVARLFPDTNPGRFCASDARLAGCSGEVGVPSSCSPFSVSIVLKRDRFVPDEQVQGEVRLILETPLDISGIYMQIQGFERVRFRQRAPEQTDSTEDKLLASGQHGSHHHGGHRRHSHKGHHHHHHGHQNLNGFTTVNTAIPTRLPITQPYFLQSALLCTTTPITRFRGTLSAGLHTFPFSVQLPGRLPPSLHFSSGSRYLAEIQYEATVQVFRSSLSHSHRGTSDGAAKGPLTTTIPLTVGLSRAQAASHAHMSHLHPVLDRTVMAGHVCCLSPCEFGLSVSWERNTFLPGETVALVLQMQHLPASRTSSLRLISVKLVQELVLAVTGQSFRLVKPIAKSKFRVEGVLLSTTNPTIVADATLTVPPDLAPTATTAAIQCRYHLVFEVDMKWHQNVLMASEVVIN